MHNLFKAVAREVISTLTVDDLKEIMDGTVATVLEQMDDDERLAFSVEIVSRSFRQIVESLEQEERKLLLLQLVRNILADFPLRDAPIQDLVGAIMDDRAKEDSN